MIKKRIKKTVKNLVKKIDQFMNPINLEDYYSLKKQEALTEPRFLFNQNSIRIIKGENTSETNFDRHYIYHPAWAIRILKERNITFHIDISSTLHFCSMVSAYIQTDFYDYRPAPLELSNLKTKAIDLNNLNFASHSIHSISCMHTVEHIGLGRYGDALDYNGDLKAISELSRVLAPGGILLFVVPIGWEPKIIFNAHRIYSKDQIITYFKNNGLELLEFTLIPENQKDGGLVVDPDDALLQKQTYGCGCFLLTKKI